MQTGLWDELGDTIFVIAMAGAIGLTAANLAVQVNKERAAFDAAAISQKIGQPASSAPSANVTGIQTDEPAGQLNY